MSAVVRIETESAEVRHTDKSEPTREHDCIWCMACVSACTTQATKVDKANQKIHQEMRKKTGKEIK